MRILWRGCGSGAWERKVTMLRYVPVGPIIFPGRKKKKYIYPMFQLVIKKGSRVSYPVP
jgi:hypothetical protein